MKVAPKFFACDIDKPGGMVDGLEKFKGVDPSRKTIVRAAVITIAAIVVVALGFVIKTKLLNGGDDRGDGSDATPTDPFDDSTYGLHVLAYKDDFTDDDETTVSFSGQYNSSPVYFGIRAHTVAQANALKQLQDVDPTNIFTPEGHYTGAAAFKREAEISDLTITLQPLSDADTTRWQSLDTKNVWIVQLAITTANQSPMRNYVTVATEFNKTVVESSVRNWLLSAPTLSASATVSTRMEVEPSTLEVTFTPVQNTVELNPADSVPVVTDSNGNRFYFYNLRSTDAIDLQIPQALLTAGVTFDPDMVIDQGADGKVLLRMPLAGVSRLAHNDQGFKTYTPPSCQQYGIDVGEIFVIPVTMLEDLTHAPDSRFDAHITFRGTGPGHGLQTHLNVTNNEFFDVSAQITWDGMNATYTADEVTQDGFLVSSFITGNAVTPPADTDLITTGDSVIIPTGTTLVLVADPLPKPDAEVTPRLTVTFTIPVVDEDIAGEGGSKSVPVPYEVAPSVLEGQTIQQLADYAQDQVRPNPTFNKDIEDDLKEYLKDGRVYLLLSNTLTINSVGVDERGDVVATVSIPAIVKVEDSIEVVSRRGPTLRLTTSTGETDATPAGNSGATPAGPSTDMPAVQMELITPEDQDTDANQISTYLEDAKFTSTDEVTGNPTSLEIAYFQGQISWTKNRVDRSHLPAVAATFELSQTDSNVNSLDTGRNVSLPPLTLAGCPPNQPPSATCIPSIDPAGSFLDTVRSSITVNCTEGTCQMQLNLYGAATYQANDAWPIELTSVSLDYTDRNDNIGTQHLPPLDIASGQLPKTLPFAGGTVEATDDQGPSGQSDGSESETPADSALIFTGSLTPDALNNIAAASHVIVKCGFQNVYGPPAPSPTYVQLDKFPLSNMLPSMLQLPSDEHVLPNARNTFTAVTQSGHVQTIPESLMEMRSGDGSEAFKLVQVSGASYPYDPEIACKIGIDTGFVTAVTEPPMFIEALPTVTADTRVITLYRGCWCLESMGSFDARLVPPREQGDDSGAQGDSMSINAPDPLDADVRMCPIDMDTSINMLTYEQRDLVKTWYRSESYANPFTIHHTQSAPFFIRGTEQTPQFWDNSVTKYLSLRYFSPSLQLRCTVAIVPDVDAVVAAEGGGLEYVYARGMSSQWAGHDNRAVGIESYRTYICDAQSAVRSNIPASQNQFLVNEPINLIAAVDVITGDDASPLAQNSTLAQLVASPLTESEIAVATGTQSHYDNAVVAGTTVGVRSDPFVKYVLVRENDDGSEDDDASDDGSEGTTNSERTTLYQTCSVIRALMEWQPVRDTEDPNVANLHIPQLTVGDSLINGAGKYTFSPYSETAVGTYHKGSTCTTVNTAIEFRIGVSKAWVDKDILTSDDAVIPFIQFDGAPSIDQFAINGPHHCITESKANLACTQFTSTTTFNAEGEPILRTIDTVGNDEPPEALRDLERGRMSAFQITMEFDIASDRAPVADNAIVDICVANSKYNAQYAVLTINTAQIKEISDYVQSRKETSSTDTSSTDTVTVTFSPGTIRQYGPLWRTDRMPSWLLQDETLVVDNRAGFQAGFQALIGPPGNRTITFPTESQPVSYIENELSNTVIGYMRVSQAFLWAYSTTLNEATESYNVFPPRSGHVDASAFTSALSTEFGMTVSYMAIRPTRVESGTY